MILSENRVPLFGIMLYTATFCRKPSTSSRRLAAGILFASLCPAASQSWPTKPVRVIVPFTAGSAVDIVARAVMEQVSTQIGQPVIVENRGGAGGTLGVGLVAKADPDGHTILVHSSTHAVTATTYANPGYDARATMSTALPAVNGTITRTGLVGQL